MPTIRVELMEGRTPEQKKNLVKALTEAVVETLGSKPDSVDVVLYDIKRSDLGHRRPALVREEVTRERRP